MGVKVDGVVPVSSAPSAVAPFVAVLAADPAGPPDAPPSLELPHALVNKASSITASIQHHVCPRLFVLFMVSPRDFELETFVNMRRINLILKCM